MGGDGEIRQLKENDISISHINNPIYHLGLESSEIYLKKNVQMSKISYVT